MRGFENGRRSYELVLEDNYDGDPKTTIYYAVTRVGKEGRESNNPLQPVVIPSNWFRINFNRYRWATNSFKSTVPRQSGADPRTPTSLARIRFACKFLGPGALNPVNGRCEHLCLYFYTIPWYLQLFQSGYNRTICRLQYSVVINLQFLKLFQNLMRYTVWILDQNPHKESSADIKYQYTSLHL